MIINKINLRNFGKFNNKVIEFGDRMNIVYGENEAGKSTLSTAIKAYFYTEMSAKKKYKKNCIPIGEDKATFDVSSTLDNGDNIESFVTLGKTNAKTIVKTIKKPLDEPLNTGDMQLGEYLFNLDEDMFDSVFYIKDLLSYQNINANSQSVSEELSKSESNTVIDVDITKVLENIKNEITLYQRKTSSGRIFPKEERLREIEEELFTLNRISLNSEEAKKETKEKKELLIKKEEMLSLIKEKEKYLEKYESYINTKTQLELREKINKTEEKIKNISLKEIFIPQDELDFLEKYSYFDFSKVKSSKVFIISAIITLVLTGILGFISPVLFLLGVVPLGLFIFGSKENKKYKELKDKERKLKEILSAYDIESFSDYIKKKSEQEKQVYEANALNNELLKLKGDLKDYNPEYAGIYLDKPDYSSQSLKTDFENLSNLISDLKIEIAKSEEREKNAFNNLSSHSALTEEKETLTAEISKLKEEAEIAKDAYDILNITAKSFKASFIPYLNEKVKEILNGILSSSVDYLSIKDDLSVEIRMSDEANLKDSEFFSQGMGDLINFALRIAIYSILCDNISVPLILDDCFIELDDIRFAKIMDYLDKNFENQIIYFTAHKRIFDLALENSTFIRL